MKGVYIMADQIRMSPEAMHTKATQYRTEAETVEGVIKQLDSLLTQLQSEWEGAASRSYAVRFGELRPSFVKANDLINEIAQALDKTAAIVAQTDSDIASQFSK